MIGIDKEEGDIFLPADGGDVAVGDEVSVSGGGGSDPDSGGGPCPG